MTIQLAEGDPRTLDAATIGAAWLAVTRQIMVGGVASRYEGLPIREIAHVTLRVARPNPATRSSPGSPSPSGWPGCTPT